MTKLLLALMLIGAGQIAAGSFVSSAQAETVLLPISSSAVQGTIPYPNSPDPNTTTYTFEAATSGDIIAYFFGNNGAAFTDTIGMMDGATTYSAGLNNQTSTVGQSFDLGSVKAGDVLTFYLNVVTHGINGLPNYTVYSNPALNPSVPGSNVSDLNEVYATPFSGSSSLPAGEYLGFEDGTGNNFVAEQVVLTATPLPAALPLFAGGLGLVGLFAKRRKRKGAVPAATA